MTAIAYNWFFEMGVLVVALLIVGAQLWLTLPYLVLAILLLLLFTVGLGLILSIVNVYFRDTEHLVTIALQLWMYLTPVIYPLSLVQQQSEKVGPILGTGVTLLDLYQLNPMESFIQLFRTVMYDVSSPSWGQWGTCAIWAFASVAVGLVVFARKDRFLAEAM
jgi:ABC-2 type transport system permease protein